MMNQRYAAIDQGTTGTRVVVFGEDGRHHSPASMPHKQITPNPGWVEHDASRFWRISAAVSASATWWTPSV